MMKTAAAKKVAVPAAHTPKEARTLKERTIALLDELLGAPTEEQREVLSAWRDGLDKALDDAAERIRPKGESGIPADWIRHQMDIKGGHCRCLSYSETTKEYRCERGNKT